LTWKKSEGSGKIEAVRDWKSPTTKKSSKHSWDSQISTAKSSRIYAKGFLTTHTIDRKKDWNGEGTGRSSRNLIRKMSKNQYCGPSKNEGKLKMEMDGSGFVMGAVLMQTTRGMAPVTIC